MLSGFELYPRLGAPGYTTWPTGHRCMTDRMWLHRIVSVLLFCSQAERAKYIGLKKS